MAPLSPQEQLTRALACAAITPGLRTLLVFDARPHWLEALAGLLARMLHAVTGQEPLRVNLGEVEDEDTIWGGFGLSVREGEPLVWRPGLLAPTEAEGAPRLVLVPDLTRLALSGVRAGVVLAGADVAHLERHGQSRAWRPDLCWLAGCARSELGRLSPHLLDRFALRLDGSRLAPSNRFEALRRALAREPTGFDAADGPAERYLRAGVLSEALRRQPTVNPAALCRVVAYFSTPGGAQAGARRELALARLADALARLEGDAVVDAAHVDAAAGLIGLKPPESAAAERRPSVVSPPTPSPAPEEPEPEDATAPPESSTSDVGGPVEPDETLHPPKEAKVIPAGSVSHLWVGPTKEPYPEDTAPVAREQDSLRTPPQRRAPGRGVQRGTIIGVEPARELGDLALTSTLMEAAKFQPIRRKQLPGRRGMILSVADLRAYRRAPPPERLLVLVIDYTALADWDWGAAVLPYLQAAYVERAAVCLVQVGSADAEHELRARRIVARSILAPRFHQALDSARGGATPLAHGLELALETLQHALRHGRGTVTQARLVVVTDGRGNVPLEASRAREVVRPLGDEGVRNALEAAERLRALDRVAAVLIHPSPRLYPELPVTLAQALGAEVRALRREVR